MSAGHAIGRKAAGSGVLVVALSHLDSLQQGFASSEMGLNDQFALQKS
jgi:hypothetical protein